LAMVILQHIPSRRPMTTGVGHHFYL